MSSGSRKPGTSPTAWLWMELHDLFDTDDGSLPEIRIDFSDGAAVTAGYALLRARTAHALRGSGFWSKADGAEVPIDSVPNAAALVVSGEAEPFHVRLSDIRVRGVTVPDLGVFVFQDQLALDYRMGSAWGPAELEALFETLADLTRLDPAARLSVEEFVLAEESARFQRAWSRWSAERTS